MVFSHVYIVMEKKKSNFMSLSSKEKMVESVESIYSAYHPHTSQNQHVTTHALEVRTKLEGNLYVNKATQQSRVLVSTNALTNI